MSDSLSTPCTRLLHPWDSPGKSTRVGCHFLLQGIFPTQGLNPGLPTLQADALPSELFGGFEVPKSAGSMQDSQWCSSSPKGSQLEVQNAPVLQFKCKVFGEDQCPSSKQSDKSSSLLLSPSFLYYSSYLQLIG